MASCHKSCKPAKHSLSNITSTVIFFPIQKLKDRLAQQKILEDFISDRIVKHEETFDSDNIRDFVDCYIQQKHAESEDRRFTGKVLY